MKSGGKGLHGTSIKHLPCGATWESDPSTHANAASIGCRKGELNQQIHVGGGKYFMSQDSCASAVSALFIQRCSRNSDLMKRGPPLTEGGPHAVVAAVSTGLRAEAVVLGSAPLPC